MNDSKRSYKSKQQALPESLEQKLDKLIAMQEENSVLLAMFLEALASENEDREEEPTHYLDGTAL